mgnify:FL=1
MNFIDYATIHVKAGNGGHGCVAFLREKFRPKGGPSGGDGGNGGNIIIKTDSNLSTLNDLTYNKKYIAKNGANGQGKNMHGKNGLDVILKVPVGTLVKDVETDRVLVDLDKNDITYIVAKGGNGGFGNARFKTQRNTAPRIANDGQKGEEKKIDLELKILADIGLVGFPNAGKSTLISKISNAKPRIADYPFTTLVPNLGIVKYHDYKSFVVADIPGLIRGASSGKGLGIQFLKHIERTKVLAFLIDASVENIEKEYKVLLKELENYSKSLLKKPRILLITKIDLLEKDKKIKNIPKNIPVFNISSIANINLDKTINEMYNHIV